MTARIALLGTSHWHAQMHIAAARSVGAEIVGCWDQNPEMASAFARANDIDHCADIDSLLDRSPDLTVLMGHPEIVPGIVRTLIARRLPMILEKPAVSATPDLVALARESAGLFIAVPLANRLSPAITEARGRIAHASFRIVNGPPGRYRDDGVGWMLDKQTAGGGALRNLGLHGIDSALSLATGTLRIVSAQIGNRIHPGEAVEDHSLVVLVDEAGAVFTVEAGYTYASMAPGGDFEWRVATDSAYLIDRGSSASLMTLGAPAPLALEPPQDRYTAFLADTLSRLSDGRSPLVGIAEYRDAMALIDQAYEMAGL